jgi:hypothetical protein
VGAVTAQGGVHLIVFRAKEDATHRRDKRLDDRYLPTLPAAIEHFVDWLEAYGTVSYDHQSYFAGPVGGRAKALYYRNRALGTVAVAPMVLSEAFVPGARRLFGPKLRFPIADAHYAMGFARLAKSTGGSDHYEKAVAFLESLIESRCRGYEHYCWGYPFDWVTRTGVMVQGTPLITTTPYAYEAFSAVHELDGDERWLKIMRSTAEHGLEDIGDAVVSPDSAAAGYNPFDTDGRVVNASAYRAFLLISAAVRFGREDFRRVGERNLNFVLQSQQPDGSWWYAMDGVRDFVDHFHTCFVLKALAKIEQLVSHPGCTEAIEAGVEYYVHNLFDDAGLPRPFSSAPRITVYKRELYDYAECMNLGALLADRFPLLDERLSSTVADLLDHWCKADGSFRSRRLLLGWDNVPMHRWAQAQLFRSLCMLLPPNPASSAVIH